MKKVLKKMLTGYTRTGKEVWKSVPEICHPFVIGDIIERNGERFVVIETDNVSKKYPYETNSTLEIGLSLFSLETGTYDPEKFWMLGFPQDSHAELKLVGKATPELVSAILEAQKARKEYYAKR